MLPDLGFGRIEASNVQRANAAYSSQTEELDFAGVKLEFTCAGSLPFA